MGHVYVDSHYYDDDDSEEDDYDDYYDHDCHYNPKKKTRECMGENEIRTVLKFLNAGVKRVHFCVRIVKNENYKTPVLASRFYEIAGRGP